MHVQSWKESYGRLLPPEFFEKQEAALPNRIERYREFIAAGHTRMLAHDPDGQLVGLGAAGPGQDDDGPCERELFMLYTLERIHGRGVGQALVEALIGDGPAYLWVLDDNPTRPGFLPSQRFCAGRETPTLRPILVLAAGTSDGASRRRALAAFKMRASCSHR